MPAKKTNPLASREESQVSRAPENNKFIPAIVTTILLVLTLASAVMAYYFYDRANRLKLDPQTATMDETAALVKKIGELIVLPADEQPTLATVADPEKLKDQPFFANAKTGDKVLIYTNARKAILYNPASNKIVEVAPVNIGNQPKAPEGQ